MAIGQALLLALIGLWALLFALQRLLPGPSLRLRRGLADWLEAGGRARWLRWLGARLRPAAEGGHGCGGCSGCPGRKNGGPGGGCA